jgi:hypothetical protein
MPAHAQDDLKNAGVTAVGLQPAVYTTTTAGTGRDMSMAVGPIHAVVAIGVVHADTTAVISFTESATVSGTYTAITGATAITFIGTADGTVVVSVPFEPTLPFVKATITTSGATESAGCSVIFEGMKKSF